MSSPPPPQKQVSSVDGKEQVAQEETHVPRAGCGILGRYPVTSVLIFAVVGVGIGVGLSTWDPSDPNDKEVAVKWIGLIGDMFIRVLKAVVLPLVFVNVILSIVEMMAVGRASTVGGKTIGLYLLTTLIASIIGIVSIMIFRGLFETSDEIDESQSRFQLGCNATGGDILAQDSNGNVFCSANLTDDDPTQYFSIVDVDGTFVTNGDGPAELTVSETIYDGVFGKLITSNIFESFVDSNFAAVVLFAIFMGAALSTSLLKKKMDNSESVFISFLKEIDGILITLIHWIILFTPFAVLSLIARDNPFGFLKYILPAQTTAFACASSAATMPVSLECAEASGRIPKPIARFVIPLGATINMDGSAIYFPCACVWLAVLNGLTPTFANYIMLVILSTIGSAGTAPVPSAGLVMVLTAYNSVFNTTGVPDGFEFVVAIDWFLDRLQTVVNVTGDNIVAASISHMVSLEESDTSSSIDDEEIRAEEGSDE
eukprot:scaffold2838_cov112-Cylindrotheca_fusiformis.AAC.7